MHFDSMFYISKDSVDEEKLKLDLTVYGKGYQGTSKIVRCYKAAKNYWKVPVPYAIAQGWTIGAKDNTPDIMVKWPETPFDPRDNQGEVLDKLVDHLLQHRTGRLSAPTGYGKTQVAFELARRMNQNILFLAHKEDILKQASNTAERYFNTECGYIKGKQSQADKLVTLATMQTLAKRVVDRPDYLSNWGLVVFDEMHKTSCASYVAIMEAVNRRYTLGISATHRRSDGLAPVWDHHIGKLICAGIKKKTLVPKIEVPIITSTGIKMSNFFDWQGEISHTKVLTVVSENQAFNNWLTSRIVALRAENRRVVLVTNRKEQLEVLEDLLVAKGIESGIYAGGKHRDKTLKDADLYKAMTKNVILATVKKIGEGFDEEAFLGEEVASKMAPLDTIIIASPITDSEQVIGRIGRRPGGQHPLIIHPVIDVPYCKAIFNKCVKSTYKPLGIL